MKRLTTEDKQFSNLFDYLSAKKNNAKAQFEAKFSVKELNTFHKNANNFH